MAYTLKNRALPEGFDDQTQMPCIFCGRVINHFNGEGSASIGMVVNSCEEGEARSYLYCHQSACAQRSADERYEHSMWFCGCEPDYIDVIGKKCPSCGADSRKPAPICGEEQKREYVYTLELRTTRRVDSSSVVDFLDDVCLDGSISLVYSAPHVACKKE